MDSCPFSTALELPPKDGFTWIDGITWWYDEKKSLEHVKKRVTTNERCLVRVDPQDDYFAYSHRKTYDLFSNASDSGAFRTFANLDEDEDRILKFANRYGWLRSSFSDAFKTIPVEVYERYPFPGLETAPHDNFAKQADEHRSRYGIATFGDLSFWCRYSKEWPMQSGSGKC